MPSASIGQLAELFPTAGPNAPVLSSVLLGRRPGRAFVDDLTSPTLGVVVSDYGFTFIAGHVMDRRALALVGELARAMTLYVVWPEGEAARAPPLDGARFIDRMEFSGPATTLGGPCDVPIVPIDGALLERCRWRGEVMKACGSGEAFVRRGLGRCAVIADDLAAEAYGLFEGEDAVEIGAITHPDYRRRGLGKQVVADLISAVQATGRTTVWSCHVSNAGSMAMAKSLGYTRQRSYRMLQLGPQT